MQLVAADVFAAELLGRAIEMLGEARGARTASNHRSADEFNENVQPPGRLLGKKLGKA
jgi:hypothetical protein